MSFAFFRKYNKILLAVGGSVLMVLFLIPQAASTLMHSPGDQVLGTMAGKEITGNENKTADGEITVLRGLLNARYASLVQAYQQAAQSKNQLAAMQAQQEARSLTSIMQSLPRDTEAGLTWLMMIHEAGQQGLYASRSETRAVLQSWGITANELAQVKKEFRIDDAFIYQALSHYQVISRLRELTYGEAMIPTPRGTTFSVRLSDPALRHFARNVQSQVGLDLVAVPASIMIDDVPEPTDAEIEERFKLSAAAVPGPQGGTQYGFGYRIPPRVKIEYIAVPLTRAKQAVTIDEVEANRYYLEHPNEFLPKPETPKPDANTPLPYSKVREDIIEKLTDQKAAALQQQAVKLIQASLNAATRGWALNPETGYHDVPADAASAIDITAVAEQVQKATGIQLNVVHDEKQWQPLTKLSEMPEFGNSYFFVGSGNSRQPVAVAGYIASARELQIPNNRPQSLHLQVGMPALPVTNDDHTVFIFRLLDAQPSHPPVNLDEVRDQVVHDVKLLKAYGSVQQQAEYYLKRAREQGLDKLAESLGKDIQVRKVSPFSRRDFNPYVSNEPIVPTVDVVGQNKQFVDNVFRLVEPAEATGSLDALPPDDRIGSVAVDQKLSVYIVKLTEYRPLTEQEYNAQRDLWAMYLGSSKIADARQQAGTDPFGYDALAVRVGYTPARANKSDEENNKKADDAKSPVPAPADDTGK